MNRQVAWLAIANLFVAEAASRALESLDPSPAILVAVVIAVASYRLAYLPAARAGRIEGLAAIFGRPVAAILCAAALCALTLCAAVAMLTATQLQNPQRDLRIGALWLTVSVLLWAAGTWTHRNAVPILGRLALAVFLGGVVRVLWMERVSELFAPNPHTIGLFSLIDKWPVWGPGADHWIAITIAILLLLGLTSSEGQDRRVQFAVAATGAIGPILLNALIAAAHGGTRKIMSFPYLYIWNMGPRGWDWMKFVLACSLLALTGPIWLGCERILTGQRWWPGNRWLATGALGLATFACGLTIGDRWTISEVVFWFALLAAPVAGVLVRPGTSIAINLVGLAAGCVVCAYSGSALLGMIGSFAAAQIKKPRSPEASRSWRNGTY